MKLLERQKEARDRKNKGGLHRKADPTDEDVGSGAAGREIS